MKSNKYICFGVAATLFAGISLHAMISVSDLASKIDAGGTYYDISIMPYSLRQTKEPVLNFVRSIYDKTAGKYDIDADIMKLISTAADEIFDNSGIGDFYASAASSLLVSGSEETGDALYRNRNYLFFAENRNAWLHDLVFNRNSDMTELFASLPDSTVFAAAFNGNMGAVIPVLKKLDIPEITDDVYRMLEKMDGTFGIVLRESADGIEPAVIMPAECMVEISAGPERVIKEMNDYIIVSVGDGWGKDALLATALPVKLADKAGFIYVGSNFFSALINSADVPEFLKFSDDMSIHFDEETILTVRREGSDIAFEEYSHTDAAGSISLLLDKFILPVVMSIRADVEREINGIIAETRPVGIKWFAYYCENDGFPPDSESAVAAGIVEGKNGKDFIYMAPEAGENSSAVPVCIMAPRDGSCTVVFADCNQSVVAYNDLAGVTGVIAALHAAQPMPARVFRQWINIAEDCSF